MKKLFALTGVGLILLFMALTLIGGGLALVIAAAGSNSAGAATCAPDAGLENVPEQYRQDLADASAHSGISQSILAAQIQQESGWKEDAVSPRGAQGLAQFMPATWAEYGQGDPFNGHDAIRAQGAYMKDLHSQVSSLSSDPKTRIQLTLAAYNAGPGAVRQHNGVPPYSETQDYVRIIMAAAQGTYTADCVGDFIGELGTGEWTHPLPGSVVTSPFGPRPCPLTAAMCAQFPDLTNHRGIDFSTPGPGQGTFLAVADMRITVAENQDHPGQARSYGGWIKAEQVEEPHLVFEYHHCATNSVQVKAGDTVAVGTPLCTEGDTGNAKRGAHHLHFQIMPPGTPLDDSYQANKAIDPMPYLISKGVL